MMYLHFDQFCPTFLRDFEFLSSMLAKVADIAKIERLELKVDRKYTTSMHDLWHGSSFLSGVLPLLIVSKHPIAPIACFFSNQLLMVTRFCG